MAHHKRRRPKIRRAGCLMCKPNKMGQGKENEFTVRGFSKIRGEKHQREDLKSRG